MIGIVMAGGRGTRMKSNQEKLLFDYKKPIILHVIDALKNSKCFSKIVVTTSPHTPKTKKLLTNIGIETIETSGNGYSNDLNHALRSFNDYVLITPGDLPFLDGEIIKHTISEHNIKNVWTSIVVTKKFLESLHLTSNFEVTHKEQQCILTGISLVNAKKITSLEKVQETYQIINDKRIAFNLNTKQDYELLSIS